MAVRLTAYNSTTTTTSTRMLLLLWLHPGRRAGGSGVSHKLLRRTITTTNNLCRRRRTLPTTSLPRCGYSLLSSRSSSSSSSPSIVSSHPSSVDKTGGGGSAPGTSRCPIYVAATRQHVGKTSVSLALLSGLQKRFPRVGFMKPVGQQTVEVTDDQGETFRVDKDAALVKQQFGLDHISYKQMSPLIIRPGYTRDYVDGKVTNADQRKVIERTFREVSISCPDVVLCEGTGHVAVGSIVEASNAQVAGWLGAKMVLVVNGGLGKAFDELEINKNMCEKYGVGIAGVIMNKVRADKFDQTREYMEKVLKDRWDVPLLGCVVDRPFLGSPALSDLERLFPGSSLVSGQEHRLRHYRVQDCLYLVATSLDTFIRSLRRNPKRSIYVCHASRNDIILGFLMEALQIGPSWESSMVVTGCNDHPISTQVLEIITGMKDAPPVLLTPEHTSRAMEMIHNYTPKLNFEDEHRVKVTVDHYEPFIDFDLLLDRVQQPLVEST